MDVAIEEVFLLKCLKNAHPGSKICLRTFEDKQKNIVASGTNYTSEILRASVEYDCDGESLQESFVIKVPQLSPHYEFLNQFGFYDKEAYMYNEVLSEMAKMVDKPPIPRHFFTTEAGALVLQDLTVQGYTLKQETILDLVHSLHVLEGMAKFHAASTRLDELDPNILAEASHETMCTKGMINSAINASYWILLEALKGLDVDPKVLQNFADYEQLIREGDILTITNRRCQFNVLNHGDMKTNNMLFKCDQQPLAKASPVVFVDYQTCRWNSPVLDMIFFEMVTMDFVVYQQHHEQLLHSYLTTLNQTLARLGSKQTYTAEDYNSDMSGCRLFQMYNLLWIGWLDIRETRQVELSPQVVTLPEEDIQRIRQSSSFRNRFLKWFRRFEKLGFFK